MWLVNKDLEEGVKSKNLYSDFVQFHAKLAKKKFETLRRRLTGRTGVGANPALAPLVGLR